MIKRFFNYVSSFFTSEATSVKETLELSSPTEFYNFYKAFDFSSLSGYEGREFERKRTHLLYICLQKFIESCQTKHNFKLNLVLNRHDSVMACYRGTPSKNKYESNSILSVQKLFHEGFLSVWKQKNTDNAFFGIIESVNYRTNSIRFAIVNTKGILEYKTYPIMEGEYDFVGILMPFDLERILSRS